MSNITIVDLNSNLEPSEPIEKQEEPNVIEKPTENQIEILEAPKEKKPRAPRKKKVAEPNPEPVIEIDSTMEIKTIEEAKQTKKVKVIKKKKEEVIPEPVVEVIPEPVVEVENKNIKTVELVECPDCKKQLTQRTLKYSHKSICPAMKPAKPEKVEQIIPEPIIRKPIRMSARSERYKNLVVHAF